MSDDQKLTRIAVVDDDETDRRLLLENLHRYALENQIELVIDTYIDGIGIVSPYPGGYQIIFMDIQMQCSDGISTAKKIRERDQEVIIIFLTHFAQYAIHGYSVGAMNFIIKPITYLTVCEELNKAFTKLKRRQNKNVLLHNVDGMVKVNLADILYAETVGRSLTVHTSAGDYQIYETLTNFEKTLDDPRFFRCHRAYLVNMYFVERVKENSATIRNAIIPVSRYKQKEFNDFLINLLSETM